MLLVQQTINAVVNKISIESHNLEAPYYNRIFQMDSLNQGIRKAYGGYFKADIGGYVLSPELFTGDWPPPINGAISMAYSAITEAAAVTFLTGTAHRTMFDRESVKYDIYGDQNDYVVPDATAYAPNDTLVDVFTDQCGVAKMNLTLDSTLARNPSPGVTYTTSGEQLAVDFLDGIAAFFTHMFYIFDGTLYLMDMAANNGTRTLTENDYFGPVESPVEYFNNVPCAIAKAGDYSAQSAYYYGDEISETDYTTGSAAGVDAAAALALIITYQNKDRCRIAIPFLGDLPAPGEQITLVDTSQIVSTTMVFNARIIQYDFDNDQIIIEGEGEVTAT